MAVASKALIGWEELVPIPIAGKELTRQSFILWQKGAYRKKAALLLVQEVFKKLKTGLIRRC